MDIRYRRLRRSKSLRERSRCRCTSFSTTEKNRQSCPTFQNAERVTKSHGAAPARMAKCCTSSVAYSARRTKTTERSCCSRRKKWPVRIASQAVEPRIAEAREAVRALQSLAPSPSSKKSLVGNPVKPAEADWRAPDLSGLWPHRAAYTQSRRRSRSSLVDATTRSKRYGRRPPYLFHRGKLHP
jgi:hypothetical protein